MRLNLLKTTLQSLLVISVLSFTAVPAHANVFSFLQSIVSDGYTSAKKAELHALAQGPSPTGAASVSKDNSIDVEKDLIEVVIKALSQKGSANSYYIGSSSRTEAIKVDAINNETHTKLKVIYQDTGPVFQFFYDDTALKNPEKTVLSLAYLTYLTNIDVFKFFTFSQEAADKQPNLSPHALAELLTNASAGSFAAQTRLAEIQVIALEGLRLSSFITNRLNMNDYVTEALLQQKAALADLEIKAANYARAQQKALDKWKAEFKAQDKLEAQNEKLNDLILNNDRAGVARMLEAYLPWAVMEPVEIQTWKTWIEAIEHPDRQNTTVAFRGVDYSTDKIQRKQTVNGEAYGFMSTVLTKNQGSYTRRLRSLSTNREKNGDRSKASDASKTLEVTITDQMISHSYKAQASNFLSFSYEPSTAKRFAKGSHEEIVKGKTTTVHDGGLLVVEIDSRRLVPNIVSALPSEIELLVPLIIFPDEVVRYHEGGFKDAQEFQSFVTEISEKTKIEFADLSNLQKKYAKDGYKFFKDINENAEKSVKNFGKAQCSKVF